jgi:hypothetical protein
MSEEENNVVQNEEEQTQTTKEVEKEEELVPKSVVQNLRKNLTEQARELKQFKEAEAKKQEEEKLAQGKYDELIKEREDKITALEAQLRETKSQSALQEAMQKANVKSQWLNLMLKEAKASIQYDGDEIVNLSEAVSQLIQDYPDAFKSSDKTVPSNTATTSENKQMIPASQWMLIKDSKEKLRLKQEGLVNFDL